jgi:hypothetical protein
MTAADLERVLLRYPGHPFAAECCTFRAEEEPLCEEG